MFSRFPGVLPTKTVTYLLGAVNILREKKPTPNMGRKNTFQVRENFNMSHK